MEAIESFEVEGLRVELYPDEDGEHADPRQWDNLGIMVCWHPDYVLGDEQIRDGSGRGAVERRRLAGGGERSSEHRHSGRFKSIGMLARWASLVEGSPVVLPLYLYDHSGITITAGAGLVVGETPSGGYDEFGSPHGWDTTLCGVIYTTPARVAELCGDPVRDGDRFYAPRDYEGTAERWLAGQLRGEVREYAAFLEGRVYGYVVKDEAGELLDSCWGFLADTGAGDELEHVRSEARAAAESEAKARVERRRLAAEGWLAAHRHEETRA